MYKYISRSTGGKVVCTFVRCSMHICTCTVYMLGSVSGYDTMIQGTCLLVYLYISSEADHVFLYPTIDADSERIGMLLLSR